MIVLTSAQMKELEKKTIEDFEISEEILMERAGISVVQSIWNEYGDLTSKSFVVVCGTGNNGGDGYVIARDLLNYTEAVRVISLGEPKTDISRKNHSRYLKHGGVCYNFNDIGIEETSKIISEADIVIDALFGTGLNKDITDEKITSLIELMNIYSKCIVSVDIPSGVCADSGKIMGSAIQADLTVTFGYAKPGHLLFPGRELTGKLKVARIGIPTLDILYTGIQRHLLTEDEIKLPERPRWANKSTFAEVIIIGGSKKYVGAPILTALAAQRSGAGMVKILSQKEVCRCALNHDPSLICVDIGESFNGKHVLEYLENLKNNTVIVVGPGWDLENLEEKLNILDYLIRLPNPLIIDADGLNILSNKTSMLKMKSFEKNIILTPHPGEFSRLTGETIKEVKQNYERVESFSRNYNVITVLKDSTSIISDGANTYFNITGNTSLSKAGSGDILSGIISALLSQHLESIEAVKTAVYKLGLAAELVPNEGMNSAFQLLNLIPNTMAKHTK
ncbi:MAG: bifunctional ADP-dependent NAD(P)H-hydrate dehydratase/NAD(P)H-hydrate epimerase [Fervidobacterium sp.]|uniref:Bifunctional NAD(P)H-hydrate repair enzyme n=1 Tax=Fervidobacterium gondwanense DSM 13020 TaxID=1121883 RepID=A0A1M7SMC2_FERGO|nr:bifunctional ADP-dependent NAD(P)H-hydrate dehydratase/NAD(P)H-hydrate epimerase [Fervidobacterium gondwanense]UXF01471.1 carbohydrate kinase [Fervidobacterium riparium]SHN59591.1 NAD(P)H-hydrate epimerase [Fervidobacterium gondwanense DSM 13020]